MVCRSTCDAAASIGSKSSDSAQWRPPSSRWVQQSVVQKVSTVSTVSTVNAVVSASPTYCIHHTAFDQAAELVKSVPKGDRREVLQAELAKVRAYVHICMHVCTRTVRYRAEGLAKVNHTGMGGR